MGRAELLKQVLEELQVQKGVLVSPSLSGQYSLPFLMQSHELLHGFVPIAPVYNQNYTRDQFWAVKVSKGGRWERSVKAGERALVTQTTWGLSLICTEETGCLGRFPKQVAPRAISIRSQDHSPLLFALQTPTLIMYGDMDQIQSTESMQRLRYLPNHSVVKLHNAGHACYLQKPQDFHLALLNFLDNLP